MGHFYKGVDVIDNTAGVKITLVRAVSHFNHTFALFPRFFRRLKKHQNEALHDHDIHNSPCPRIHGSSRFV